MLSIQVNGVDRNVQKLQFLARMTFIMVFTTVVLKKNRCEKQSYKQKRDALCCCYSFERKIPVLIDLFVTKVTPLKRKSFTPFR